MTRTRVPVAVIIPSRDYGRFLHESIGSLAAQTVLPEDILVVDDASTDDTQDVLAELRRRYPDLSLRTMRHDTPRGFSATLIEAIAATSAPFIAHVDADDRALPTYLESLYLTMTARPELAYAYPKMRLFGTESGVFLTGPFSPARLVYDGNYIPHIGMMRRSAYDVSAGYQDLPTHVDWDLWLTFVEHGLVSELVDEILYEWRRHEGSMTLQPIFTRAVVRLRILRRHRRLLVRYALPGSLHLLRSLWRRVRVRAPIGRPPYGRTPSCWISRSDA